MKESPVYFHHVVYFWLKQPNDESVKKAFVGHLRDLTTGISEIKSAFIGAPAPTNRPVIDNTYSFSIVLAFDSQEDQDAYQVHPTHLKFIERAEHMWEKVQVYDSIRVS